MLNIAEAKAPTVEEVQDSTTPVLIAELEVPEPEPLTPREYAKQEIIEKWGIAYWDSFDKIIAKESNNWTVYGDHPGASSAFGLGGFLNATWAGVGGVKTYDPYLQVDYAILYVEQRYGDPVKAWNFHIENNWY